MNYNSSEALLALMDTLAAFIIVLTSANVIYKICPFLFFLFPKSGHGYHLLFYCSDLVRFFTFFFRWSHVFIRCDHFPTQYIITFQNARFWCIAVYLMKIKHQITFSLLVQITVPLLITSTVFILWYRIRYLFIVIF